LGRTALAAIVGAAAVVAALLGLNRLAGGDSTSFCRRWPAMGTVAQIQARSGTGREILDEQRNRVQLVYERLEGLLSAWNPESELGRLSAAGCTNWVEAASPEVKPCYEAALRLAEESGGAFNPRIGEKLRTLGLGGGRYSRFDLGAIAKGFAVDVAADEMERAMDGRFASILLDLGGNLRAVGAGEWSTGVRNPFRGLDASQAEVCAVITLASGESVATSGSYERFVEKDGRRLSHILDGRTGEHVGGIAGVTVVTPREYGAMLADGLSTTLFVLGPEAGAAFLKHRYPRALALWIPDDSASPRILATSSMADRIERVVWPVERIR
jgi:thiamine biosynthesis lipoprotein